MLGEPITREEAHQIATVFLFVFMISFIKTLLYRLGNGVSTRTELGTPLINIVTRSLVTAHKPSILA